MINRELEHERLEWQGKILKGEGFRAEHLWNYFDFLGRLHGFNWAEYDSGNPYLTLLRPDDYFYRLSFGEGTPDLDQEKNDSYELSVMKFLNAEEKIIAAKPVQCRIRDKEDIGIYSLEKKADNDHYVMWWDYQKESAEALPLPNTVLFFENGRTGIADCLQNANSFGRSLALNMWNASEFTLGGSGLFTTN